MSKIYALDDHGLRVLGDIARESPNLFMCDDIQTLLANVQEKARLGSVNESDGFQMNRSWTPSDPGALDRIKGDVVSGPDKDADHARLLRQWLPALTASDAANSGVLASICCFHLGGHYIHQRWYHGSGASSADKNPTAYIKKHWLVGGIQDREQANTIGRLWWLYELARTAEPYSAYDMTRLLNILADNRGLYHGLLRFPILKASNRIRATVIDAAVESNVFNLQEVVSWMSQINRRGGAISLDVLDDEDLKRVVRDCLPPKGGAGP